MQTLSYRLLVAVFMVAGCQAHREFQNRIPNGDQVPHPCKPNFVWRGVGHLNPLGGGPKNSFGEDFVSVKKWTTELCRKDSDNDGMINGEELGDPDCTWRPGTTPSRVTGITHPGVCDPWGSEKCKEANKLVTCNTGEFICPDIHSPDVFNITLRFPATRVPAKETTYICYNFDLDMLEPSEDYHLIASEPFIDNPNVMHHTILTGCTGTNSMTEPVECLMGSAECTETIAAWTVGMSGDCIYKEAGFRIGKNGYSHLMMQHHWTNPMLVDNYVDSSGMILYLTQNFRKYDAGYFSTGETDLVIPPGENRVVAESTCSSECTDKLIDEKVYLFSGLNHMHYLGYSQNVEHYRNGVKLRDLTPDSVYSYDNPIVHVYNPPVELLPGDALKTTCVYRSISRTKTAKFGEGSFDEMCFGVFTYFPKQKLRNNMCVTYGELDLCTTGGYSDFHGCDLGMILNGTNPERKNLLQKVLDSCDYFGGCRKECPAAIAEVERHPCFSKKIAGYINYIQSKFFQEDPLTVRFLSALQSCSAKPDGPGPVYPTASAENTFFSAVTLLLSATLSYFL